VKSWAISKKKKGVEQRLGDVSVKGGRPAFLPTPPARRKRGGRVRAQCGKTEGDSEKKKTKGPMDVGSNVRKIKVTWFRNRARKPS